MRWRLNYWIFKLRRDPLANRVSDDEYDYMVDDDFIDIKNYSRVEDRERRRMLKKRMYWYIRNGFFDLAENIDTCFWSMKQANTRR